MRFLKELSLTEGRGTGIPKMLKAMRLYGSPPPVFETDRNRTYFLVRLPLHPKFVKEARARKYQATGQITGQVRFCASASNRARPVKSNLLLASNTARRFGRITSMRSLRNAGLSARFPTNQKVGCSVTKPQRRVKSGHKPAAAHDHMREFRRYNYQSCRTIQNHTAN